MEIGYFYSKQNSDHRRKATIIRKAVKNLGLSATITEGETKLPFPRLVINGIDLSKALEKPIENTRLAYDNIVKLLEKSAWSALW